MPCEKDGVPVRIPQTLREGVVGAVGVVGEDGDDGDDELPPPQFTTVSAAARKDATRAVPPTSFTCSSPLIEFSPAPAWRQGPESPRPCATMRGDESLPWS
jgi:hypothetical protein